MTRELSRHHESGLASPALPELIPPAPPPVHWVTPAAVGTAARPAPSTDREDTL
ncbi:hypothetical protein ACIQOV_38690 [Kitasatospora sp. NPDC091257]|uniref:hypothetical protein n=1 Tax=Kitasatospora sp. NPDC091257 TaxID=3364084 RepID=UPI003822E2CC